MLGCPAAGRLSDFAAKDQHGPLDPAHAAEEAVLLLDRQNVGSQIFPAIDGFGGDHLLHGERHPIRPGAHASLPPWLFRRADTFVFVVHSDPLDRLRFAGGRNIPDAASGHKVSGTARPGDWTAQKNHGAGGCISWPTPEWPGACAGRDRRRRGRRALAAAGPLPSLDRARTTSGAFMAQIRGIGGPPGFTMKSGPIAGKITAMRR